MQVQLFSLKIHQAVLHSKLLKIRPLLPAFTPERAEIYLREEIVMFTVKPIFWSISLIPSITYNDE